MGENRDKINELQKTAKKLTEDIQNMSNYKNLYNDIQVTIIVYLNLIFTSYIIVKNLCNIINLYNIIVLK